ncbi:MAG: amino acid decarboxylase, partial [Clostridia bacterium]|nr:amino acid decarboxylase [Clostridia bacterium]
IIRPTTGLSIREAMLSPAELVSLENAVGRICAAPTVSCPPAVPIAVAGEYIDESVIALLRHYGVDRIKVIKE